MASDPRPAAEVIEFHEEDCKTAQQLLDVLRPGHVRWDGKWIFRGQGEDWPLLPTAHRVESWATVRDQSDVPLKASQRDDVQGKQVVFDEEAERAVVLRFRDVIASMALRIPQRNTDLDGLAGTEYGPMDRFLTANRIPLVALAQHHGLPTRLLDWTSRPPVAAYFAATAAAKRKGDGMMVVWALRADLAWRRIGVDAQVAIELVNAPYESNPHLHAQAGLFTLIHQVGRVWSVDEVIRASRVEGQPPFPWMRKFTTPKKEALRVLRRLAHDGITASLLFPDYHGAAAEIRARAMRGESLHEGDGEDE